MSVPAVIGRLDILSRLGSGATATVWLAHDPQLDSHVAIKVLADILVEDAEVRRRFLQEARLLRAVDSDAVVRTHDVGELDDGRPYIVMTFADRGTLEARAGEPWTVAEALRMGLRLASAVEVLHGSGVLHRDIKPSNVLFRSNGTGPERLLLADLGLGKPLAALSQLTLASGTPGYAPPEQFSGQPLTTAADVYAVTGVIYRLLSGSAPNDPRPDRKPLARALAAGDVLPAVPKPVRAVLAAGLAADPADRPATAAELATRLESVLAGLPGPAEDEPAPPRRRRPGLVAGVLAAVLLAGTAAGGVVWWLRPVALTDRSERIVIAVPRAWTAAVDGGSWDATAFGGPADNPSLFAVDGPAATDRFAAGSHSVFVGLAGGTGDLPAAPAGCRPSGGRTLAGPWRGELKSLTCSDQVLDEGLITDGAGTRVLLQVTRPAADGRATEDVLAGLSVRR
jgi:hypothetical protein